MNQYVYAEKFEKKYQLFSFTDGKPHSSTHFFSAIMMSRLDFEIKVLKIPIVNNDNMRDLLKYKIRSIYPGTPDETVFDYRIMALKKERYAVLFITTRNILNEYKKIGNNKPLFLPYTIIKPIAKKYMDKNTIFTFWHSCWIEILYFEGEVLKSSVVFKTENKNPNNTGYNFQKFLSFLPKQPTDEHLIFICPDKKRKKLEQHINNSFKEEHNHTIFSIEEQLNRINRKSDLLFTEKPRLHFISRKLRIRLLLILAIVLSGLILHKYVSYRAKDKDLLNDQFIALEKKYYQMSLIKNDMEDLERELSLMEEKKPIDIFLVLSKIFQLLDEQTEITYFSFEEGNFQFEAIGPNALILIQKFNAHPNFTNIRLLQIIPVENSDHERFRITGIVKTE